MEHLKYEILDFGDGVPMVTLHYAARLLGVHVATVRYYIRTRKLAARRIESHYFVKLASVEAFKAWRAARRHSQVST